MRKTDMEKGVQMVEENHDVFYEVSDGAIFSLDKYTPWYGELKMYVNNPVQLFAIPLDIDGKLMDEQDMVIPDINHSVECLKINKYKDLFFHPRQIGFWFDSVVIGGIFKGWQVKNIHLCVYDVMENSAVFKQHVYYVNNRMNCIIFGKFVRDGSQWWTYHCNSCVANNYMDYIQRNLK